MSDERQNRNQEPTVLVALPGERVLAVVVTELSSLKVVEAFQDEKARKRSKGEVQYTYRRWW